MAKTSLYGFSKGAKQIVNYLNGELITKKQYDKETANIKKMFPKIRKGSEEYYELDEKGQKAINRKYDEIGDVAGRLNRRLEVSHNYVAFLNYTNQLLELNSRKEKGITREEINQLAANNKAISTLPLHCGKYYKYGSQSSSALEKYQEIIMANDYKKLQYINRFPASALKNITLKDINNVSLPKSDYSYERDYNNLKSQMRKLEKRLDKLDANRHVNSIEFRRMKAAVKALNKELAKSWTGGGNDIGNYLDAVQETSMDYVQAKGVGRQSSQLGKDRMDLGLDLAQVSSEFMDKFISQKRAKAVEKFEKEVMHVEITNGTICDDFTSKPFSSKDANIFEDKERGIDKNGNKVEKTENVNTYNQNLDDSEMSDDDDDYEDEYTNEF